MSHTGPGSLSCPPPTHTHTAQVALAVPRWLAGQVHWQALLPGGWLLPRGPTVQITGYKIAGSQFCSKLF